MALRGEMIQVESGDGFMVDCYHVAATGAPKGGLVVIMEAFGVNDHIKRVCDDYADDGFDVISPALYDRIERNFDSGYGEDIMPGVIKVMRENGFDNPVLDSQACIDYLRDNSAGEIAIVGYCYGGAVAWLAASRCDGLSAASGYYGSGIMNFMDVQPKCPVILHFGKEDQSTPADKVAELEKAHPDVPVYRYDSGHGFNSDDRPSSYHTESAKLARERTLAFFMEQLT